MMKSMKKAIAVVLCGGAILQFGGCAGTILQGAAAGAGISIVSQLLPLGVTAVDGVGNLF